jgi:RNA polymerase sigma-70 factor (ECF subfamily)
VDQEIEDLLRLARTGSHVALGKLLEAFRYLLLAAATTQLSSDLLPKEGVSDVVQETFKDAIKDFATFEGTAAPQLKRWLLTILGHNVANVRRKYFDTAKSQINREFPLDVTDSSAVSGRQPCADTPSPSSIVSRQEEEELLRRAMARLTAEERQVIELRHLEQLDFATIGIQMNLSEEAARKRFSRAIVQLQQIIEVIKHEWRHGHREKAEGWPPEGA